MRKLWPMGFIFETEEGNIVLTDKGCFELPDSQVDKVIKLGITNDQYNESIRDFMNTPIQRTPKVKKIQTGFLYAVIVGERIKLGRTKNTKDRFTQYSKISDNFSVIAIAESSDYIAEESEMLEFFRKYDHRGEYFRHNDNLIKEVIGYFDNALSGVIYA